jgi:hypothetical protein
VPHVPNCIEMDQADTHNHSNCQDGHQLKHNQVQVYSSGLYFGEPGTGYYMVYCIRWGAQHNSDKTQYQRSESHPVGHDRGSG